MLLSIYIENAKLEESIPSSITNQIWIDEMVKLTPIMPELDTNSPRIEIIGCFGAGKTTLAKKLCGRELSLVAEDHKQVAMWGRLDKLSETGYLPYELDYLIQHTNALIDNKISSLQRARICDWSFLTDRHWASQRLAEKDFAAYAQCAQRVEEKFEPPLGYLYLRQTETCIAERLSSRGRKPEQSLLKEVGNMVAGLDNLVGDLPELNIAVVGDEFSIFDLNDILEDWVVNGRRKY